jgi:membrane-associated phospholipid phosphatase
MNSSRARPLALGFALLCFLVAPRNAAADAIATPNEPAPSAVAAQTPDLRLHLALTVVGAATWATLTVFSSSLAPSSCRWCDRNSDGSDSLNGFDASVRRTLRWSNTKMADTLSTVFSFGLAPLAGVGIGSAIAAHDSRLAELPADLLVVAESAVLAINLDEFAKLGFARERPYVHFRSPSERVALRSSADDQSFFSGHATLAFALATSAGTVASLRHYRLAPVMWAVGMVFAATGGYLRVAADQHYASDVLTGAAVGAAAGFAVPYFAHREHGAQLGVAPCPGGVALVGTW